MSNNDSFRVYQSSTSQNQSANTPIAPPSFLGFVGNQDPLAQVSRPSVDGPSSGTIVKTPSLPPTVGDTITGGMVTLPSADADIAYVTATTPLLPVADQIGVGIRSSQLMPPTMAQLPDIGHSKVPPPSSARKGGISGPSCKRKRTETSGVDMLNTTLGQGSNLKFSGPAVISVNPNEDVVEKIKSFVEEKGAIVILDTSGTLSFVQLLQQERIATFEGEFRILTLSGPIIFTKKGEPHRIGQLRISVAGSDGWVFGGRVQGRLIAASTVQIVGAFITQSTGDCSELPQHQLQITSSNCERKDRVKERKRRAKKTNKHRVGNAKGAK